MEQHMKALRRANEIRFARADIKRQLRSKQISVAELIEGRNGYAEYVAAMPLIELLRAQKQWGRKRAQKALDRVHGHCPCGRSVTGLENLPVGELTERERGVLVEVLGS